MRIGIIVTIVGNFGKKGFYNSQEIGLGKTLAGQGHYVTVLKCMDSNAEAATESLCEGLEINYLPVRRLGPHGFLPAKYINKNWDAVLAFADTQLFLPHIYRYCVSNGIKFVPYIGIAHSFQGNLKSKCMDFCFHMGSLRIYRKIPVLAKTDTVKSELNCLRVTDCTVAPVGLDVSRLKMDYRNVDQASLKAKYGFQPQDKIICFVARLKAEKRPVDMIRIFNRIKAQRDMKLLMVGEGPERTRVDQEIQFLGIADRVTILDKIPYENMWEIYHISDYYVNLRADEIFGMAVMEAVFYKTSVAAIDAPGPSTILAHMPGHKICKTDDEIVQWIIGNSVRDEDLEASSHCIVKQFTWDNCADAFIEIAERQA